MKKLIAIACLGLFVAAPMAYAEGINTMMPDANDTSASPNVPSDQPMHDYGGSSSTYKLPSGTSPLAGSTSQPPYQMPKVPPKHKKPAPSDDDSDQ